jgi:hypothetical protein
MASSVVPWREKACDSITIAKPQAMNHHGIAPAPAAAAAAAAAAACYCCLTRRPAASCDKLATCTGGDADCPANEPLPDGLQCR